MSRKPRILLLGDYSNCQRTLATGLRRLGCDVTLASDGSGWQRTERDINLHRPAGKAGGLMFWLDVKYRLHSRLKGYDVVSIHDPNFLRLRPQRLRPLFDRLKRDNGAVFLNAMSTDLPFLEMLQAKDSPLRYSEWFVDGRPSRLMLRNAREWQEWHQDELADYQHYIYSQLDGAVAALYEYWCGLKRALPADKVHYGGIPIDTRALTPVQWQETPQKVRLFLGRDRSRMLVKGTDYLEQAARSVCGRYPDRAELVIVENRPYAEFVQLLRSAHVVLDQIYSYTPATTAMMAMAYGLNVVSGAEPEFYDFIGETENRPIINAPLQPEAIAATLEELVLHPEQLRERGRQSRLFVEKHNACEVVARRFLDAWSLR